MFINIIVLLITIICLYTDLTRRKIYNSVLLPAVFLALGYHIYMDGLNGGWLSLKGMSLGLALLLIPYAAGGIGAGDVKLLGTIGSLKGPAFVLNAFLAGAIAGGILALLYLISKKRLLVAFKKIFPPLFLPLDIAKISLTVNLNDEEKSVTIPYGAAIAAGTIAAYFVR